MLPILVATASEPSALETLAAMPVDARPVDWVEIRFDQITAAEWPRVVRAADALGQSGTPVLATIRWSREGGGYAADDEARVERYREILPRVHAIDVELASAYAGDLVRIAHEAGRTIVLSTHDFEKTPSPAAIASFIAQGLALGADIVKIAAMTHGKADYAPLVSALAASPEGRVALLGMGPYGVALRAFLPAAGSALAYGYLDVPAAPGQLSALELGDLMRKLIPGYVPGQRLRIAG
jgi:3-dehydroquinate dehydratase-1